MGIEPTSTGLQPGAWPSGSSVLSVRRSDGRISIFVPKSSRPGWSHQKRPDLRQHRLNRRPLPHGQGSLRPSFSSSCLSPWTIRSPHLTCVSDGKPRRRLLMGSKAVVFVVLVFVSHWSAPFRIVNVDVKKVLPPGIEPGLRPSQSRVRSGTLREQFNWHR